MSTYFTAYTAGGSVSIDDMTSRLVLSRKGTLPQMASYIGTTSGSSATASLSRYDIYLSGEECIIAIKPVKNDSRSIGYGMVKYGNKTELYIGSKGIGITDIANSTIVYIFKKRNESIPQSNHGFQCFDESGTCVYDSNMLLCSILGNAESNIVVSGNSVSFSGGVYFYDSWLASILSYSWYCAPSINSSGYLYGYVYVFLWTFYDIYGILGDFNIGFYPNLINDFMTTYHMTDNQALNTGSPITQMQIMILDSSRLGE